MAGKRTQEPAVSLCQRPAVRAPSDPHAAEVPLSRAESELSHRPRWGRAGKIERPQLLRPIPEQELTWRAPEALFDPLRQEGEDRTELCLPGRCRTELIQRRHLSLPQSCLLRARPENRRHLTGHQAADQE